MITDSTKKAEYYWNIRLVYFLRGYFKTTLR